MIKLRPYQEEAIESTLKYFQEEEGNPLIVLPTGTGKSVVIADFCKRILTQWPDTKILVITHVRELIRQNYEELKGFWPEAPAGINSAGLNKRDYDPSIVFCGIQSVYGKASRFTKVDLVLVDEAHLIPRKTNTMYQKFLNNLKRLALGAIFKSLNCEGGNENVWQIIGKETGFRLLRIFPALNLL